MFPNLLVYLVLVPAVLIGAGYVAWRWFMPEGIKNAITLGNYGRLHGALAWFTEMAPVRWLVNRIRPLAAHLSVAEDAPAPGVAPAPADAPAPAAGPAPGPATPPDLQLDDDDVAAVGDSPIPLEWIALVSAVAAFEPGDDAEHVGFMRGHAAGFVALGEAFRAYADTCLHSIGLDPAAVQGTVELADVIGDNAHDVTLALKRFLVVYQEILAAVANGLQLPHNARQWLTGGSN